MEYSDPRRRQVQRHRHQRKIAHHECFQYHPPSAFRWACMDRIGKIRYRGKDCRPGPNHTRPDGPIAAVSPGSRFGLKYHRETREERGYSLVVAKGGPKLAKSTGHQIGIETRRGQIKGYNEPLGALAHELGMRFDNFIVDD